MIVQLPGVRAMEFVGGGSWLTLLAGFLAAIATGGSGSIEDDTVSENTPSNEHADADHPP